MRIAVHAEEREKGALRIAALDAARQAVSALTYIYRDAARSVRQCATGTRLLSACTNTSSDRTTTLQETSLVMWPGQALSCYAVCVRLLIWLASTCVPRSAGGARQRQLQRPVPPCPCCLFRLDNPVFFSARLASRVDPDLQKHARKEAELANMPIPLSTGGWGEAVASGALMNR